MDAGDHEIGQGSPLELSSSKEQILLISRHARFQAFVTGWCGSFRRCRLAGHHLHPCHLLSVRLSAGHVKDCSLRQAAGSGFQVRCEGPFSDGRVSTEPQSKLLKTQPTTPARGFPEGPKALLFLRSFRFRILERAKRFELSTPTLARLCSTTELRPRSFRGLNRPRNSRGGLWQTPPALARRPRPALQPRSSPRTRGPRFFPSFPALAWP